MTHISTRDLYQDLLQSNERLLYGYFFITVCSALLFCFSLILGMTMILLSVIELVPSGGVVAITSFVLAPVQFLLSIWALKKTARFKQEKNHITQVIRTYEEDYDEDEDED